MSDLRAQEVSIGARPVWANDFTAEPFDFDHERVEGKNYYVWLDASQYHAGKKEFVIDEMVGYYSYFSLSDYYEIYFDGSFQHITLHECRVYRDGSWLDLMKTLQYETKRSVSVFRGVEISHRDVLQLKLSEVRVGDVLHVSYTKKGVQADLHGFTRHDYYTDNHYKERYYLRLLYPADSTMQYVLSSSELSAPVKGLLGTDSVWVWDMKEVKVYNHAYENKNVHAASIPSWYQKEKVITISDFKGFHTQFELSRLNFQLDRPPSRQVVRFTEKLVDRLATKEEKVQQIFSFLQEDIYYLTNDYITPFQPEEVLDMKMGDCKAKSLLGVKMLSSIGVDAWPVLVHSEGLPSPRQETEAYYVSYNHCIMGFDWEGETHFFDPTLRLQGEAITNKYIPDYRYGLALKEGIRKLTPIEPSPDVYIRRDTLRYSDPEMPKNGGFDGKSRLILKGAFANYLRRICLNGSKEELRTTLCEEFCPISANRHINRVEPVSGLRQGADSLVLDLWFHDVYAYIGLYAEILSRNQNIIKPISVLSEANDALHIAALKYPYHYQQTALLLDTSGTEQSMDSLLVETDYLRFAKHIARKGDSVIFFLELQTKKDHVTFDNYLPVDSVFNLIRANLYLRKKPHPFYEAKLQEGGGRWPGGTIEEGYDRTLVDQGGYLKAEKGDWKTLIALAITLAIPLAIALVIGVSVYFMRARRRKS